MHRALLGITLGIGLLALPTVRAQPLEDLVRDLGIVVGVASHGPQFALVGDGGARILIVEQLDNELSVVARFASPLPHLEPGPDTLALALSADTLLVGAGFGDAAVRYTLADGRWRLDAVLRGPAGSGFGAAVAVDGDRAAIGAPFASVAGGGQGSVQLFERADAIWSAGARLTLDDGRYGDRFGASIAFADGAVAVGAPGRSLGASRSGMVSVFAIEGPAVRAGARLLPLPGVPSAGFGSNLAADADRLLVAGDDERGGETGAVHVYRWDGSDAERPELLGWEGVASSDLHGTALLLSDGRLAVAGRRELDEVAADLYVAFYQQAEAGWRALYSVDVGVSRGDRRLELADLGSELLVVLREPDPSSPGPSAWWRLAWP